MLKLILVLLHSDIDRRLGSPMAVSHLYTSIGIPIRVTVSLQSLDSLHMANRWLQCTSMKTWFRHGLAKGLTLYLLVAL